MICVRTASRLHFGVFSLPSSETDSALAPNADGEPVIPVRQFGGVGLMVAAPRIELRLEPAVEWTAEGPLAQRALGFAQQFLGTLAPEYSARQRYRLVIEHCPPEHVGLGTGTQLGLAVARALAQALGLAELNVIDLARRVGRGKRSALGIHGFAHGGFLVEAGKRANDDIALLVARVAFPETWRVLLITPARQRGLHGISEIEAFTRLDQERAGNLQIDALCRLVLLGMLPAIAEADLRAFGETLYDFNRRVGELFRPVQGGVYADARSAEIVAHLRQNGIRGVGQSSWGPTLFAVVEDDEHAEALAHGLQRRFPLGQESIIITHAANHEARVCM